MNSRDPLAQTSDASRELFSQFAQLAAGFPHDAVLNAAANLIINVLRQGYDRRDAAGIAWDDAMGRAKGLLMDCYDSVGRKKGVFPFAQHIELPPLNFRRN